MPSLPFFAFKQAVGANLCRKGRHRSLLRSLLGGHAVGRTGGAGTFHNPVRGGLPFHCLFLPVRIACFQ
jgi:hypothetical protein